MYARPLESACIHPVGVEERKARGKRASAPPRDNALPLQCALVRARDGSESRPTEIRRAGATPGLADFLALVLKPGGSMS